MKQIISIEVDVPPGKEISHVSYEVPLRNPDQIRFYVALVDAWQWPEWLTGWIAMDADGEWHWFVDDPVISDDKWLAPHSFSMSRISCRRLWPTLAMPSATNRDWRMSKRGSQL